MYQVWKLHEGNKLLELVDRKVNTCNYEEEILHVINIGLLCVQSIASKRPSMSRIVAMLQGDMEMEVVIEETQLKSSKLRSLDESLLELSNSSFDHI
jgi:deoxyribose-phosphate aldolase